MMNAVAETVTTTEQQLDLDFRINIIAGNIKKGMKQFERLISPSVTTVSNLHRMKWLCFASE